MKPRAYTPKQRMTREYNETVAFMKIDTAPIHTLTDAMVESIARSHCGGKPADYDRLLSRLDVRLMERKAREQAA